MKRLPAAQGHTSFYFCHRENSNVAYLWIPSKIHSLPKILTHPINCLTLKKIKKRSRVPASFQTVILACDIMGDISRSSRAALQGCLATRQLHVSQLPLFFLCLVQHELNVCMSTEREAGCQTQQRKAHQHMLIMLNKKTKKKHSSDHTKGVFH